MEIPATPASAPREYVVSLYNSYAETFDSHLQGALEYRTPTLFSALFRHMLNTDNRWDRCLDLGCGTGLSGRAASSVCRRLVGVDLSPAMVRRAREKRVYHRLLSAPIETGSGSCGGSSSDGIGGGDLILSCDVFVYIGDLRACFEAVRELVA
ncbi:unnamed protein product, partial [Ectocarpus sp. 13 AM-2016]